MTLSGMMDGQVQMIHTELDAVSFEDVETLACSAKYVSTLYRFFRETVDSPLQGDRHTYRQDSTNRRKGLREAPPDLTKGADMMAVKPVSHYLDVFADTATTSKVLAAAHQVSGEYTVVETVAERGWIDRHAAIEELITNVVYPGAEVVLTYWALEVIERLD